jgi:TPR repeat protein
LKAAAEQGDMYGEVNYGICLLEGRGVPVDYAKAIQLFQCIAGQRNSVAKVNLDFCFHEGLGASRDYLNSAQHFKEAADEDDVVG